MADLVLLVTTMDISSIKDSSMALDMLSGADYPMERVKLVVNHPTNLSKVKIEQLQEVTGCEVFWTIPFDKNFVKSGQEGAPIVMARANSGGARSIAKLAQAIGGGGGESRLFRRRQKQEPRTEVFATQELSGEQTS
jgi:MinD-like ATPase involved in chromosome partitioning or flagellar assembly